MNSTKPATLAAGKLPWLLTLGLVVCVPLGFLLARRWHQYEADREVAEQLERLGGRVTWSSGAGDGEPATDESVDAEAVSPLAGTLPMFDEIVRVDLSGTNANDADIAGLARLSKLREVDLRGTQVTDEGLRALQTLGELRRIDLRATRVTPEGAAILRELLPAVALDFHGDPRRAALPRATPAFLQRGLRKTIAPGPPGSGLGSKSVRSPSSASASALPEGVRPSPMSDGSTSGGDEPRVGELMSPPAIARQDVRPELRTETAIDLGVSYLSQGQLPDGRWTFADAKSAAEPQPTVSSDTAATALSLLSFLGAGHHQADETQGPVVASGLKYLLANQQSDGNLFPIAEGDDGVVSAYSHAIATLALCEAYGMTQDAALREPAQRALDYLSNSQDKKLGGWRYRPGEGADTSVTGWVMMALQSGRLAGLDVPDETWSGIARWLDQAQASPETPHLYVYNPQAPDTTAQRHGRQPTESMSAVGLLLRLYSGWRREEPAMQAGADYLLAHPPQWGTKDDPARDIYYWYYATQVLLHMGGRHWDEWNSMIHPLLVDSQIKEGELTGSWDPDRPLPDRWGPTAGRHYVTTLNLLTLQVYYRHLPLYVETAK
ncbi:MAG: hypothetical protein KDA62_01615 [Planctomycetales bacterium]|nr:hypothetical protein [Planctomycetales bacterium]